MRRLLGVALVAMLLAGTAAACSSDDDGGDGDSTTTTAAGVTTTAAGDTTTSAASDTGDAETAQAVGDYCSDVNEYLGLIVDAGVDPADPAASELKAEIDELASSLEGAELDSVSADRYEQCQSDLTEFGGG